jgi:hypothetical protein
VPKGSSNLKIGRHNNALHYLWSRYQTVYSSDMVLIVWKLDEKVTEEDQKFIEKRIFTFIRDIKVDHELYHRYNRNKEDFLPILIAVQF